ncbi:hypothetical protein AB0M44_43695 [Streptosporangium subroseum]|uniref:hypothetical protein n=1 Tax=Streptosporangium subroseum TaxID=106412 RepID=UPI00342FA983
MKMILFMAGLRCHGDLMADELRIEIRRYEKMDHDAVMTLAPRLAEGVAAWRDSVAVADAACGWVRDSVRRIEDDRTTVFVAEDAGAVVDTLLRYREEFGISYISVLEDHMKTFAEVIPLLR